MNQARRDSLQSDRLLLGILAGLALVGSLTEFQSHAGQRDARLNFVGLFGSKPIRFDNLEYQDAKGQQLSVTRLDFLVSDFAMQNVRGQWVSISNSTAYISIHENRTGVVLSAVPEAQFTTLRFKVGLAPTINHLDPAKLGPTDPLNPLVNNLHWNWKGGYVFMALEGRWKASQSEKEPSGYSFHIATDPQLMTVEIPIDFDLQKSSRLTVAVDVAKVFFGISPIALKADQNSTHSRANDMLAAALKKNVEAAFSIIPPAPETPPALATNVFRLEMAESARPFRLTISSFFPRPSLPADNPLTEEGVDLGKNLFFDQRLSVNSSQSCASCHETSRAFSQEQAASTGAEGQRGRINAMSLINLAWKSEFFWDGRATSLRQQILEPIQNPIEMHQTLADLVIKLRNNTMPENYPQAFEKAFGTREISADRVARAIEQFLLTQVSYDSKFDRVMQGEAQLTAEEQRGFELFNTEYDPRREQYGADCFHCHGGPLFRSQNFANNGLDETLNDRGRAAVSKREGDLGKFAVPSLRNVEVTGPYMHDGRFRTLEEAVGHYITGVKKSSTLDPNLAKHPDGGVPLNSGDKKALVAFLKTLTDSRFK
jgi:cytochrome c peroxidase